MSKEKRFGKNISTLTHAVVCNHRLGTFCPTRACSRFSRQSDQIPMFLGVWGTQMLRGCELGESVGQNRMKTNRLSAQRAGFVDPSKGLQI